MTNFLIPLFASFIFCTLLTPLTIKLFTKKGWLEDPLKKQTKTGNATALYPVPRGGGIPIFISIFLSCLLFLPPDNHLKGILLAASIALVVGVLDDIKDISPLFRLIINILTGLIIVASGIRIDFVSNPIGPAGSVLNLGMVGIFITLIWIVWCTNIVGWSAGIEGQLPGFVSISAIFIGILALRFSSDVTQWSVIILAFIIAGSYLGFLPYNFFPQKIMPGYSGKSLAGLFLSILSILSGAKLATLIFLLGIPMVDAVVVIFRRLANNQPIYQSDGQHLHHILLKSGLKRPQIAILYWSFSLILGFISLFLNSRQKFYFLITFVLAAIALIQQLSWRIGPKSSR